MSGLPRYLSQQQLRLQSHAFVIINQPPRDLSVLNLLDFMNKIFILFVATATMMVGCGKDDKDPIEENGCKVVKLVEDEDYVTNLAYNSDGKIVRVELIEDGTLDERYDFTYSSEKITAVEKNDDGDTYYYEYTLNNEGLITSAKYLNNDDVWEIGALLSYNANGYLIKAIAEEENSEFINEFSYSNGNLVSTNGSWIMNKGSIGEYGGTHTENITYDPTKANYPFSVEIEALESTVLRDFVPGYQYLYEIGYLGKKSKNRITKVNYSSSNGSSNAYSSKIDFSYEEDAKGNVFKVTRNDDDNYTTNYSLEYSCK